MYGQFSSNGTFRSTLTRKSRTSRKTVYDIAEIPHLWAHKAQDYARNAAGNFYCDGDTIYSYGSHFPIAKHGKHKGKSFVWFTSKDYSVTTSRHKWSVRRAIPDSVPVFHTDKVGSKPADVLAEHKARFKGAMIAFGSARNVCSRVKRYESLQYIAAEANKFCEFFGYQTSFDLPANRDELQELAEQEAEKLAARNRAADRKRARAIAEQQRLDAEREAKFRKRLPMLIGQWRKGKNPREMNDWRYRDKFPTLLRIVGDEIETNRGARFPVEHARRVLPIVKSLLEQGQGYARNGKTIHLGHYALDSISPDGTVRAGCHEVQRPEVELLIQQLERGNAGR